MLQFNPAQLRLANKLAEDSPAIDERRGRESRKVASSRKKKALPQRNVDITRDSDIPLSSEMVDLIESTFDVHDGFMSDSVQSILSAPSSSLSVFAPAAALLSSQTTSVKEAVSFRAETVRSRAMDMSNKTFTSNSWNHGEERFEGYDPSYPHLSVSLRRDTAATTAIHTAAVANMAAGNVGDENANGCVHLISHLSSHHSHRIIRCISYHSLQSDYGAS
jgi:hypothetical protein